MNPTGKRREDSIKDSNLISIHWRQRIGYEAVSMVLSSRGGGFPARGNPHMARVINQGLSLCFSASGCLVSIVLGIKASLARKVTMSESQRQWAPEPSRP